jgi:hypothetical protein
MITNFKTFEGMNFNENDVVTLKRDLVDLLRNTNTIPAGTKGTVVYVYANGAAEVEFIVDGESFVELVTKDDMEK